MTGVFCLLRLARVAVMMADVPVLFLRLVHDGRLGGEHHPATDAALTTAACSGSVSVTLGG